MSISILVAYDNENGEDKAFMVVGKKRENQSVEIINAIAGDEATELWRILTQKKEKKNDA